MMTRVNVLPMVRPGKGGKVRRTERKEGRKEVWKKERKEGRKEGKGSSDGAAGEGERCHAVVDVDPLWRPPTC
jgi:hypothetical protein